MRQLSQQGCSTNLVKSDNVLQDSVKTMFLQQDDPLGHSSTDATCQQATHVHVSHSHIQCIKKVYDKKTCQKLKTLSKNCLITFICSFQRNCYIHPQMYCKTESASLCTYNCVTAHSRYMHWIEQIFRRIN